ncbi:MAG: ABC transporter permease [Planctomycetales bacterium]|nr:ABC transporter permease [Planctomycetales bacterium]
MIQLSPYAIEAMVAALALAAVGVASGIPISYNVRNLLVRWPATLMTAAAFTMVIGLLVVMLAFVNGMAKLTESSGRADNLIILSEGATDESFSNLGYSDTGDIENDPHVLRDGDTRLVSKETYFVVNQPIDNAAPGRPKRRFLQLRGVDDPQISGRVHDLKLVAGGAWFSPAGVRALPGAAPGAAPAIEVVVGSGIAGELAKDRPASRQAGEKRDGGLTTGDTFALGERTMLVVGVMQSSGSTFDSEVWAKRSILGPMFGKETYTSLVLRTADAAAAQSAKQFFTEEYDKAAVQALVETEYFASLSNTNKQFLVGIQIVAVIMAIGGVFGVMNTMFAAVSQRRKDIGVLRLLGYGRWQIAGSFVFESLVLAVLGGALGCAVGALADGWTANSIVSSGQGGGKFVVLRLVVDASILGNGMLLALAMGAVGGLLPAANSIRLQPLEALR